MILLIDNFDSFSYNLYQLIGSLNPDIRVLRNNSIDVDGIARLSPERIVLSPGPGRPSDAGICEEAIAAFAGKIPILGVCLGHQAICEVFGGTVGYAGRLMHGKQSTVTLDTACPIFRGLSERIPVARYHSLAVDPATLPSELVVTALTDEGEIMAVRHRDYEVYGVQFHPESILTPDGRQMMENFLK